MELTAQEVETARRVTDEILSDYSGRRGELIPILQKVQEKLGYVPAPSMEAVADRLGIPPIDVYGVVTFYNQFRLIPPGRHQIKVCMGTACHMRGGNIILDSWKRRLKIDVGQVTPDREFSLERVACVGCCTMAPVTVIDDEVQPKVTPTRVDGLLFSYGVKIEKEGEKH